jgi:hypothetical protein
VCVPQSRFTQRREAAVHGTETVVIVDDEPNPHHTLLVHPPDDPTRTTLVVFDQLALCDD